MEGPIFDHICPKYYWVQVQQQLECCDLDECDFWQCNIQEYPHREAFVQDTDEREPFRSAYTGFEKGAVIQLMPYARAEEAAMGDKEYWEVAWADAQFLYPPKIEMSPHDVDVWIAEQIANFPSMGQFHNPKHPDYDGKFYIDRITYWRLVESKNVTIHRDREWFKDALPVFKKMWDYVTFFRENDDVLQLWNRFIEGSPRKNKRV